MSQKSRHLIRAAILFCGLPLAGGAFAQSGPSDVAEARLRWAERHMEFVCRPLAIEGRVTAARRCEQRVVRIRGEALTGGEATASLPGRQLGMLPPRRETETSPFVNRRCAGIACLRQFSSLGVGF